MRVNIPYLEIHQKLRCDHIKKNQSNWRSPAYFTGYDLNAQTTDGRDVYRYKSKAFYYRLSIDKQHSLPPKGIYYLTKGIYYIDSVNSVLNEMNKYNHDIIDSNCSKLNRTRVMRVGTHHA